MLSHLIILRYSLILSSHLCLGLRSRLFPSGFPTKTLYVYLLPPICTTLPAPLIPTKKYLVKSTNHEGNCNKIFSILLLFLPSEAKISSLGPPTEYPQPTFFVYCERTAAATTTTTISLIAAILLCLNFNNQVFMR